MESDSKATKILLLLGGSAVGIALCALVATFYFSSYRANQNAEFADLSELRGRLAARDERDVLPDNSVSLRSIVEPHPDDRIIYRLLPDLDVTFRGARVRTNTHRMRGPETDIAAKPGTFRIALLSDSFGFGWGVEEQEGFAHKLAKNLETSAGRPVEVLNFSVPGYSTFQEVAAYRQYGRAFKPDLILVYFVENDFGPPFFIRSLEQPGKFTIGHMLPQVLKKLAGDADAQAKGAALYGMLDPNPALSELANMAEQDGVRVFLTINPRRNWEADLAKLTVLKTDSRITLLPVREQLVARVRKDNIDSKRLILSQEDPHPTPLMHTFLAEILADGLRDHIR